jgi:protein-S-isoprenylcysteine O-methyltransferase Ste14
MRAASVALGAAAHAALLLAPCLARGAPIERPRWVVVLLLVGWGALEARVAPLRAAPGAPADRLHVLTGLSLLATAWLAIGCAGDTVGSAGIAVGAAGIALRIAAIRALGPAFGDATEPSGPRVTTGVYGMVRHPSELGLVLVGAGVVLAARAPAAALPLVIGVVPSSLARILREERALARLAADPRNVQKAGDRDGRGTWTAIRGRGTGRAEQK